MNGLRDGIFDLVQAVRTRAASASEILEDYITQIEKYNRHVNALVDVDFKNAREQAKIIDESLAQGDDPGPLAGVPLSIKEAFAVDGMATTCGFESNVSLVPDFDAPAVLVLKNAGAVIIGKSNVPTSLSGYGCSNPIHGQTQNPWALDRSPGGSSGGASAIASGFSALDLASDLSGSIRIPASWCGVAGLRPSAGKLSKRGHLPWPLDTTIEPPESVPGLIAATADDLAFVWNALWPTDPVPTVHMPPDGAAKKVLFRRIGVWGPSENLPVDREVGDALSATVDALRALGHKIETFRLPFSEEGLIALARRLTDSEITFALSDDAWGRWDQSTFTTRNYLRDLNTAARFRQLIDEYLQNNFDAILCPATPICAPMYTDITEGVEHVEINRNLLDLRSISDWSLVTSILHLPSVTIPVGLSENQLPIGMQVAGRNSTDSTLLGTAWLIETAIGSIKRPDLHQSVRQIPSVGAGKDSTSGEAVAW